MMNKFLLVASSPYKQKVKISNMVYIKNEKYNRLFYLLKLLLIVFPPVCMLVYNLFTQENEMTATYSSVIWLGATIFAFIMIQLVVPSDILHRLEKE